uniref:Cyclin T1 n=1 Tax=Astyanax mexicanus TaxID=7994 RepID=A0A8B9R654_ASTMX
NFESTLNNNDIFFSRWYFTREQIENSPSRRAGLDPDKELSYRQQAANFIQDMGQRLNLYPLHRSFFRALAAARVTCLSSRSQTYVQQSQDLVALESIILQTLAFDITIDHPHSHVVKCTQLVRGKVLFITKNSINFIRSEGAGVLEAYF